MIMPPRAAPTAIPAIAAVVIGGCVRFGVGEVSVGKVTTDEVVGDIDSVK